MIRALLLAATSLACHATPMLGNGSSTYSLTVPPELSADGITWVSHLEQTVGGVDRDDTWFINVAITVDTVDREWSYVPVPQWEPCCASVLVPDPQQPTETPEPGSAAMLAVILMALVWFRAETRGTQR